MKKPTQIKLGFSFFPTLQYSSTPKELEPVPAKQLNFELVPRIRFSMLNKKRMNDRPDLSLVPPDKVPLARIIHISYFGPQFVTFLLSPTI